MIRGFKFFDLLVRNFTKVNKTKKDFKQSAEGLHQITQKVLKLKLMTNKLVNQLRPILVTATEKCLIIARQVIVIDHYNERVSNAFSEIS